MASYQSLKHDYHDDVFLKTINDYKESNNHFHRRLVQVDLPLLFFSFK